MGGSDYFKDSQKLDFPTRNEVRSANICKYFHNLMDTCLARNWMLNFGLVFETLLAAFLAYCPGMSVGIKTYPIK